MKKSDMINRLDIVFLHYMNSAIESADLGYCREMIESDLYKASGVLQSASILGLLTKKEFDNINHTIHFTSLRRTA